MVADVSYPCISVAVDTPDGRMFVVFIEDNSGNLIDIQIHIGKSGTALAAWVSSICVLLRTMISSGYKLNDLIVSLSNITTHRVTYTNHKRIPIRSGPDGLVYAMMKYDEERHRVELDPRNQHEIFTNRYWE